MQFELQFFWNKEHDTSNKTKTNHKTNHKTKNNIIKIRLIHKKNLTIFDGNN